MLLTVEVCTAVHVVEDPDGAVQIVLHIAHKARPVDTHFAHGVLHDFRTLELQLLQAIQGRTHGYRVLLVHAIHRRDRLRVPQKQTYLNEFSNCFLSF